MPIIHPQKNGLTINNNVFYKWLFEIPETKKYFTVQEDSAGISCYALLYKYEHTSPIKNQFSC